MTYEIPYCFGCVHYGKDTSWPEACRAFPVEIPSDIYFGRKPHDKVLPGQEGDYVYTPPPAE